MCSFESPCVKTINFKRKDSFFQAYLCIVNFSLHEITQTASKFLNEKENICYNGIVSDNRRKSYLLGRYAAKLALSKYFNEDDLTKINIEAGVFEQPVVCYVKNNYEPVQTSITHSEDWAAALAFPEKHPMGIDIEMINNKKVEVVKTQLKKKEKILLSSLSLSEEQKYLLVWTAKESLSKVLKCGLMIPFKALSINKVVKQDDFFISYYEKFSQYKCFSFFIEQFVLSITLPRNSFL